jgi:signal transduction histidine kinase
MNELIHTLLNVTRLEAGNINVTVKSIDFGLIIEEAISEIASNVSDKEITLKFINHYNRKISTDPLLVREVVTNLLSNAIKYTPPQGKIVLRLSRHEKTGRLVFSIKDNGYGIPHLAQNHIFSKFYRAKNAVKNDVSGTGLGLYLVKQIVETINGDLWFKSKTNEGSTFYFALPTGGSATKKGKFTLE